MRGWLKFRIPRQRYVKFRSNELILYKVLISYYHYIMGCIKGLTIAPVIRAGLSYYDVITKVNNILFIIIYLSSDWIVFSVVD